MRLKNLYGKKLCGILFMLKYLTFVVKRNCFMISKFVYL